MLIRPLILTIKQRQGDIFRGEVEYVTSINDKGRFDVLPEHTNFSSLIKDFIKYKISGGDIKNMKIENAVMRVYESKVDIFLGI